MRFPFFCMVLIFFKQTNSVILTDNGAGPGDVLLHRGRESEHLDGEFVASCLGHRKRARIIIGRRSSAGLWSVAVRPFFSPLPPPSNKRFRNSCIIRLVASLGQKYMLN